MPKEFVIKNNFYTVCDPQDFWIEVMHRPIYRSSKSGANPHFLSKGGLRPTDFKLAKDPFIEDVLILPSPYKGLSFADSIETLRNKR